MAPTWLDRSEYPFTSHYFSVGGQRQHYIDEGVGETLLFVHGTPSWSFDFRNVIKALRGSFRCIAIDHIGFGLSDKPEQYDYSTINHGRTLERFILEKGLRDITMVMHDFGGPIGMSTAIRQPDRVKRTVLLNSWMWGSAADPDFIKLSKVLRSPLLPFLYRWLNFSPRFILPSSFGEKKLPKQLLSQYTRPFADRTQRNGALAFAHSLLNDQDWFESLWNDRHVINGKPTLFIWGMKDPVIRAHNLQKFLSGFPDASACELPNSGHFPQEEEPERVAQFIFEFMKG